MDSILRRLKLNELKARILLYEREHSTLLNELKSMETSTERRGQIYRRQPQLWKEHTEALNDVEWLTAEDRLRRPDRKLQHSS